MTYNHGIVQRPKRSAEEADLTTALYTNKRTIPQEYIQRGKETFLEKLQIKYPFADITTNDIHYNKKKSKWSNEIPDYLHDLERGAEQSYGDGYTLAYSYKSEETDVYVHTKYGAVSFELVDANYEKLESLPDSILTKILEFLGEKNNLDVIIYSNRTELHHDVQMQNSTRKRNVEFYHLAIQVGERMYTIEIDVDMSMINASYERKESILGSSMRQVYREGHAEHTYHFLNKTPQCPQLVFNRCRHFLIEELKKIYPGRTIIEGEIQIAKFSEADLKICELVKKAKFEQFKVPGYYLYLTYRRKNMFIVNTDEHQRHLMCPSIQLSRLPTHIHTVMLKQINLQFDGEYCHIHDLKIIGANKVIWTNDKFEVKVLSRSLADKHSVEGFEIEYEIDLWKCYLKVDNSGNLFKFHMEFQGLIDNR